MIGPGRADRHRPLLRRVPERARRLPGHDRARRRDAGDGTSVRLAVPAHHDPRPGRGRGRARRPARHRPVAARGRRVDGRAARARVGGGVPRAGRRARWSWRAARRRRPSRSRCAAADPRDRGRPEVGAAATTTTPRPATARTWACRSHAASGRSSYRSELEFDERFGREPPGRRATARGRSVRGRVVPRVPRREARARASTRTPTSCCREAMNHHDVGPRPRRHRAGARRASPREVTIAGISSDRLYPLRLQHELAELIPTADGVTVDRVDRRPRRLPHRDRSRRQDHHPRPGLDPVWTSVACYRPTERPNRRLGALRRRSLPASTFDVKRKHRSSPRRQGRSGDRRSAVEDALAPEWNSKPSTSIAMQPRPDTRDRRSRCAITDDDLVLPLRSREDLRRSIVGKHAVLQLAAARRDSPARGQRSTRCELLRTPARRHLMEVASPHGRVRSKSEHRVADPSSTMRASDHHVEPHRQIGNRSRYGEHRDAVDFTKVSRPRASPMRESALRSRGIVARAEP